MKIKLSKNQWQEIGEQSGWTKKAQQQVSKQQQVFENAYRSIMQAANSLRPDLQNKVSAAFSNAYNSVQQILKDPNSWM